MHHELIRLLFVFCFCLPAGHDTLYITTNYLSFAIFIFFDVAQLIKYLQHAHVSRGEVIGLLGGTFNKEEKVLKVGGAESNNVVNKARDFIYNIF